MVMSKLYSLAVFIISSSLGMSSLMREGYFASSSLGWSAESLIEMLSFSYGFSMD